MHTSPSQLMMKFNSRFHQRSIYQRPGFAAASIDEFY
jgi:hypothetical protein